MEACLRLGSGGGGANFADIAPANFSLYRSQYKTLQWKRPTHHFSERDLNLRSKAR